MDTTAKQPSSFRPGRTARPTLAALAAAGPDAAADRRIARLLPGAADPERRDVGFNSAL
ncbi:hypothetical protein ABZ924_36440 [Streptomyces sp. NPDC046876]|uniref:hypothetical protein n=1 Tax=Streptomyces sp. NPDC046876 TaxID=3155616 RepID=UPI003402903D